MKILFADSETTGVDNKIHCIHQLSGAIAIEEIDESGNKQNIIKEVFDIKFRPKENAVIDDEALKVCNITKEELLSRELSYQQGYECFLNILNKYINKFNRTDKFFLTGYNINFDKDFLYQFFVDNGNQFLFSYIWGNPIDVMTLCSVALINNRHLMQNFKQGTVAKYFGFNFDETQLHDALFDIYICIGLYSYVTKTKFQALNTFFNYSECIWTNYMVDVCSNPSDYMIKTVLNTKLTFGKYNGQTIGELVENHPGYIVWLHDETNINLIPEEIYKICLDKHTQKKTTILSQ